MIKCHGLLEFYGSVGSNYVVIGLNHNRLWLNYFFMTIKFKKIINFEPTKIKQNNVIIYSTFANLSNHEKIIINQRTMARSLGTVLCCFQLFGQKCLFWKGNKKLPLFL